MSAENGSLTYVFSRDTSAKLDSCSKRTESSIEARLGAAYLGPMPHFHVIFAGSALEHFWGIESIDDEGSATLLRERFTAKQEAEAEALRMNLLEAARRAM